LSSELKRNGTHSEVVNKPQYPIIAADPLYINMKIIKTRNRRININFKGTGIFDLKRTQIYTHTFA
jgi:hypothetical protein